MSRKGCRRCGKPYRPTSGHNFYCKTCARASKCRICNKLLSGRGWQCQECTAALAHLEGIHNDNIKRPPVEGQEERIRKYEQLHASGQRLFA